MLRSLFFSVTLLVLCISFVPVDASPKLMAQLVKTYTDNTKARLAPRGTCRADNLALRKEWGELDKNSRLAYIKAVKCLHKLSSKIGASVAPGARSRYDDFEAIHILNTPAVHATALFLPWHRHFLYLFETALRTECGYAGYQPYWDWAKYAEQPLKANPLYDGSPTSLSGNGKYIPGRNGTEQPLPLPIDNPPALFTPPGFGGGYIFEGPFVDWELHLGPAVNSVVQNGLPVNPNPRADGLGYNPRRMIRDFNNSLLLQYNTYPALTAMIANLSTIHEFHPYLFGNPHTAGHLFISGYDNDLFTSPQDPIFWFHHAQVDRLYSIWQGQDFSTRDFALDGTLTLLNIPPTRNATLDDPMHFELTPDIPIRAAMSVTQGQYCYIYT